MEPESSDLAAELSALSARLAALEAQVAQLTAKPAMPQWPAAAQPPARPAPARPAPKPSAPPNPGLVIAFIGAGIFLLGAVFFLWWSVQQGWLGPAPRMGLGILAGAAMAAGAARMILKGARKLGVCVLGAGLGTLILSLYYGTQAAPPLIAPLLGFGGTAVAVFFAGALAARAKSGGALVTALLAGFIAPIAFSQGGHHEVALAVYLAALMGAALAVPYAGKAGARWIGSRLVALIGVDALLCAACDDVQKADAGTLLLLLALHAVLAGLWLWLPKLEERPRGALILWMLEDAALSGLAWLAWQRLGWMTEGFAAPLLILGAANLAMVKPLRARMGDRSADLGLLALAAAHLALAIPVALAWSWAGVSWGLLALCFAGAASLAEDGDGGAKPLHLQLLGLGFAILASFRWLAGDMDLWGDHLLGDGSGTPFFNATFATGLLATLAWVMLARKGALRILGFLGAEIMAHLVLPLEIAYALHRKGADWRHAGLALTFFWALSGAAHWLRGLKREGGEGRALMAAGYVWLGFAAFKLIVADLNGAGMGWRALAFLLVGGIFLGVALMGQRLRPRSDA